MKAPKLKNRITRKEMITTLAAAAAGAIAVTAEAGETTHMALQTSAVESNLVPGGEEGADAASAASAEGAAAITAEDLKAAEKIAGIEFSDTQRAAVLASVSGLSKTFAALRKENIPYTAEPPTHFAPLGGRSESRARVRATPGSPGRLSLARLTDAQIAFLSVRELAHLVRTRQISPVELTRIYLDRLKRYGDKLLCVITLTEELALKQAEQAEAEIARGEYRGPLHGIPYGIKDLFSTRGIPTTWGAAPYEHQTFDDDATVVERLQQAGAVLVAKLSMGALAMDDIWFRGKTKNPWNPQEGSSGSSAGSASATAAGLVGFSIGTETLGSITSPSHRCRVTGLRPTYGRVSRHGAMGLSYTMDKIGPICREVEDCALVFAAICGEDPHDETTVNRSFVWKPRIRYDRLHIGFLVSPDADLKDTAQMDKEPFVQQLRARGAKVRPVKFTPAPQVLMSILEVEAASAFDALTRGPDLDRVENSEWPAIFRGSRYVPAVEYLQAQRLRAIVMRRFEDELADLDLFLAYGVGGYTLSLTNYTGHPQALIPYGVSDKGQNHSVSLIGRLYQEDRLLAVARTLQDAMPYHRQYPDLTHL